MTHDSFIPYVTQVSVGPYRYPLAIKDNIKCQIHETQVWNYSTKFLLLFIVQLLFICSADEEKGLRLCFCVDFQHLNAIICYYNQDQTPKCPLLKIFFG